LLWVLLSVLLDGILIELLAALSAELITVVTGFVISLAVRLKASWELLLSAVAHTMTAIATNAMIRPPSTRP